MEKILSSGVFTNEIDQSFLPTNRKNSLVLPFVISTVKGRPVLIPTIVNSYSEYVQIFGELIESGSDNYQYLTSHTAKEYLRQGGPTTIIRIADPDSVGTKASAVVITPDSSEGEAKASGSVTFNAVPSGSITEIPMKFRLVMFNLLLYPLLPVYKIVQHRYLFLS